MTVKLTICIPTYNRAEALDSCLSSICAQFVFDNINIIVVISDNASTDNTKEIAYKWISKFRFIKYYQNDNNIGGIKNFWLATSMVKTEFFWLMGDDAFLMPGSIKKALEILHSNRDTNLLLMSGSNLISDQTKFVKSQLDQKSQIFKTDNGKLFLCSFWLQTLGCISYLIVRTSLWKSTGYNLQPSFFIYPQIRSLIELTAHPGQSIFFNRLCVVNTRASDSHNSWYRDKACLSIAIEFPWLQDYAMQKGLVIKIENGLHKKFFLWKMKGVIKTTLTYPISLNLYKTIIKLEKNIFSRIAIFLLIILLVSFKPVIKFILQKKGVISKNIEPLSTTA